MDKEENGIQKEKVKKFIEEAVKAKKVQMKDVIEFISKENIDAEFVTKIYDELDKAKVNLILDDEDDEKDLIIDGKIKEELEEDLDKKEDENLAVADLDIEPDLEDIDEVEKFVEKMNYFFTNIERTNSDLKNKLRTKELEQDDLLHEIELSKLNTFELAKVATRLKKTRNERREIKDKLEFIATVKGFSDKYNNKLITGDLINLLKNIRTLRENWNSRIYKTRVLEDLKISKMKENKEGEEKNDDNCKSN